MDGNSRGCHGYNNKTPNKKINIDDSWNKVSNNLRIQIGDDLYNSWFARMEVHGFENGTLTLSLPTLFLKSWIKSRYSENLPKSGNKKFQK